MRAQHSRRRKDASGAESRASMPAVSDARRRFGSILGSAVVCVCAGAAGLARADEPATQPAASGMAVPDAAEQELGDPDFGPLVEVERIDVRGNDTTNEK